MRHIQRGWGYLKGELNEFVDVMPAQQRLDEANWYQGTADAVHQNHDIIKSFRSKYIVILAGDHIYKMNYALVLADHVEHGREVTVACIEVARQDATAADCRAWSRWGTRLVARMMRAGSTLEFMTLPRCVPQSGQPD